MIPMHPKHKQNHNLFLIIHHHSGSKVSIIFICSRRQQAACWLFMLRVRRQKKILLHSSFPGYYWNFYAEELCGCESQQSRASSHMCMHRQI